MPTCSARYRTSLSRSPETSRMRSSWCRGPRCLMNDRLSARGASWNRYVAAYRPSIRITHSRPVNTGGRALACPAGTIASRKTHVRVLLVRPTALQNDLERGRVGGVSECVVGHHDVVEAEPMRDESCGAEFARLYQFEQQWCRDGVDQARRECDVAVPQFLEVQLHRLAMD